MIHIIQSCFYPNPCDQCIMGEISTIYDIHSYTDFRMKLKELAKQGHFIEITERIA